MVDLLEKYFPYGHKLVLVPDVSPDFRDMVQIIFGQLATSFKKITVLGGYEDVQKVIDDKYLPDNFKVKKD